MYNRLLVLPILEGNTSFSFADGLAVVVTAIHPEGVEVYTMVTKNRADLNG